MKTKVVFQTDGLGFFTGTTLADESPLEPGIFHIPAGCIEVAPPDLKETEWARWADGAWVIEERPIIAPEQDSESQGPITTKDVENIRLMAYSHPLTGSDRLFSEASRMQLMGEKNFEDVRVKAISRYMEIQAANPWP